MTAEQLFSILNLMTMAAWLPLVFLTCHTPPNQVSKRGKGPFRLRRTTEPL